MLKLSLYEKRPLPSSGTVIGRYDDDDEAKSMFYSLVAGRWKSALGRAKIFSGYFIIKENMFVVKRRNFTECGTVYFTSGKGIVRKF